MAEILGNQKCRIVLCSMQYVKGVRQTLDYFIENQFSLDIQWLNPGFSDQAQIPDEVVLLASEGKSDLEISAALRISSQKAARWRKRFLQLGLAGLEKDAPRPGRKPAIAASIKEQLVHKTTQSKPQNATHWSTRTMAAEMGVSEATVRRVWRAHGLKPHLIASFKVSKDKHFAEKLEAIVGLYLNPPEHAIVMCVDEKSQIQALDRTQPGLSLKKGSSFASSTM